MPWGHWQAKWQYSYQRRRKAVFLFVLGQRRILLVGPIYDAALHSVFVGFVIAMIFGHAPIIFPAILGIPISFSPLFYVHLALLHLSMIVRVAGDLALNTPIRKWGGLLNEVAILLFMILSIQSIVLRKKQQARM